MFNKKDNPEGMQESSSAGKSEAPARAPAPARTGGPTASIGPSIHIDGDLKGEEDLVVEGRVTGTIQLRSNTLTIGTEGKVEARVFAHTILVEGSVKGDLYASERISVRQSARIDGNIYAPRISLEDGARFRGAIDMDSESEDFRKAFGAGRSSSSGASSGSSSPSKSPGSKSASSAGSSSEPGKSGSGKAANGASTSSAA